jgi:hypothetical protein
MAGQRHQTATAGVPAEADAAPANPARGRSPQQRSESAPRTRPRRVQKWMVTWAEVVWDPVAENVCWILAFTLLSMDTSRLPSPETTPVVAL